MLLGDSSVALGRCLTQSAGVDAEEIAPLAALFSPVEAEARTRLWDVGAPAPKLYFVQAGLVRLAYAQPDGKEYNKAFLREGMFVAALSASLTGQPTSFFAETLERCHLHVADFEQFRAASIDDPVLTGVWRHFLEAQFVRQEQREAMLQMLDAKARYQRLRALEPELFERVPQYHIASYLGMSEVSLSRVIGQAR